MEGLIPHFYKAIKRSATRRKYRSLSSGGTSDHLQIEDEDLICTSSKQYYYTPEVKNTRGGDGEGVAVSNVGFPRDQDFGLPRSRSSAANGYVHGGDGDEFIHYDSLRDNNNNIYYHSYDQSRLSNTPPGQRQLVRLKSHRRMFSCVTGF